MSIKELKLARPIKVNGVERNVLTYDISELEIEQIASAETCKAKLGAFSMSKMAQTDFTLQFCVGMQAVIAVNKEISEEDLMRLKGYDVLQLAAVGASFFAPTAESSQEKSSEKPQEDTQDTTTAQ